MEVWEREVCSRDPEKVQDDGLQGHDHTYSIELKLLSDASLEMVDATMHRQMIGSLRYLTDTIPDTCFAVNTLRHVQLSMGSSMIQIRRLTWKVMLI